MADEATNLQKMNPDQRAAWMRKQLVQLPGTIKEVDGGHWKVLDHTSGLPKVMVDLSGGLLSDSVCRDLNTRMLGKGWRVSEPMEGDSHQRTHRIRILPEDGLIPAAPDDKPAGEAPASSEAPPDDLDVEDLENAARALHWAASEIVTLRNRCDELATENRGLREQLAAAETAVRERPRPSAKTVALFRDGLSEVSGLQQP